MKKMLLFMFMLLCVFALLVSCNKNDYVDEEEETKKQDNVEDNIAMLIEELNKYDTLADVIKSESVTYDADEIISEISKTSKQYNCSFTVTQNGKKAGELDAQAIKKNNEFYIKATADGETAGINASITKDNLFAYALWNEDEKGNIEVSDSAAIDLNNIFENMTVNIDEYVYFKFEGKKMPIDPSVLKMPEISEEHIVYEDGKYVLDNEFLYDSLVATVDAVIDELKNNGEELPEDFEEQYDEIKKEGRKVLDAIDFEMYFLAKLEKVQGMGMSLTVDANNVADALDIDKSELGDMNYLSLFYETSDKGVDLKLEYQEYGQDMNYLKLDCDYIYTGKKLCGFDLKYELENASKTNDESKTEDGYLYEYYKNQIESLDKQSIEIMFNTSNIERANATVFDFKADIKSNSKNYYEYGNEGGVVDTNSTNTESQTVWNISAKTEKANQLSFNMDMSVNETVTDSGNKTKNNTQIAIDGTIEIITENIKLPEINEKVKSAIDKAIKNPQKLFED